MMASISKPQRQSDYNRFPPSTPIVIDNGGSFFRIGWAGESDPRIVFRNVAQRPRHKSTGETVTIVGDHHDPALLKYFDCTRTSYRSPFDNNVVYQYEIMEYVLDYAFEWLGADGSQAEQVDHPILMTECICNPISSRSKMAELLFETYGIPSVAFGVDAAFSYKFNQQFGVCREDGLAVCSGQSTSHVIPFLTGEPVIEASCRTNIGGYHVTDFFKQLLSLKYPNHTSYITWEKTEDLKMENCYVAQDYLSELQLFQKGTKEAEEKTRCWQLPWVPLPREVGPSEEELARKAVLKEKQGQRLREMAAAKRSIRITELENELHGLEDLQDQLDEADEAEISYILSTTGYVSRQEIDSAVLRVTQSLRKAKGEPDENEDKMDDASLAEKFPLVNIPDDMLTPEQVKEKRRQTFLKTTTEGRLRAKQKRFEEDLLREKQNQLEEEKRLFSIIPLNNLPDPENLCCDFSRNIFPITQFHNLSYRVYAQIRENPEFYLEQLRAKYKELSEKVDQRKRLKTNGNRTNSNQNSSGNVGRGERLNAAQRERMRLLTTAAFDRGKGEDTFGARDEDWQLYKLMSKDVDDDDDGPDEDETELARVSGRLQDIDPEFVPKSEMSLFQGTPDLPRFRPLTAEDFQIVLGVERSRCPEVLFRPSMVGIDQAGLDEMVGISLARLASVDDTIKNRMCTSILLTGGSTLFPGLDSRLEAGVRSLRPYLSPLKVVMASDPVLDAWRGAASYASAQLFQSQTFSIQDYYEKGEGALKDYRINYSL